MRLFVALDLSDDARVAVAATQKEIVARWPDASTSLRLVRPEHLHLTLVFLGEVDPSRAAAIADSMRIGFDLPGFHLTFGGLGVFPLRGRPRALFLGIPSGAPQVIELQQRVTRRLQGAGVHRDARPFHPHLTLARWRDGRAADARRIVKDVPREVASVEVTAVTLYESRLSSEGPTHTALARASLAGAG